MLSFCVSKSDLIRTFIGLNLHHPTDSKVQLYINILICCMFTDIATACQRVGHETENTLGWGGGGGVLMQICFFKHIGFQLFSEAEINIALCTLPGRSFKIIAAFNAKLLLVTCKVKSGKEELPGMVMSMYK